MARSRLSSWGRLLGAGALILGTGALLAAGRLVLAFAPKTYLRFRGWLFRAASRKILTVVGFEVRLSGKAPRPPFLLVANHLSYMDILVLAAHLPCVFVAKVEIRRWPVLGPICRGFGTIFINREERRDIPRVTVELEAALDQGLGVVLFPEGTSSSGAGVLPFRSPLLAPATRLEIPVHYAALGYRTLPEDPPAHLSVCWWGGTRFVPHVLGLIRLRWVEASIDFGDEPLLEPDRKLLAVRLREGVLGKFQPVTDEEPVPDA
jgi:1-acyl-sn-glycerol-3-phosphate acyltransferase